MRTGFVCLCLLAAVPGAALAADDVVFETDANSATLRELAKPLVVDESRYGCGPLSEPGKTYYVSVRGSDEADGLSPETALRHVRTGVSKLRAASTRPRRRCAAAAGSSISGSAATGVWASATTSSTTS